MAHINELLLRFERSIRLDDSKEESLRTSRDALRSVVENYFSRELELAKPTFRIQGSYAMRTVVNPIDEEFDIDDGVYLNHLDELPDDPVDWELSPHAAQALIVPSVEDQTEAEIQVLPTCVRVRYAHDYHVDLPVYVEHQGRPYLADTREGWFVSDAQALLSWFREEARERGEQLVRLVRLFKAWTDYQSTDVDLPCGLVLTVLTAECYHADSEEDTSLTETARTILERLSESMMVPNPVNQLEDLAKHRVDEMGTLSMKLETLVRDGYQALETHNPQEACQLWRTQFGDRFPSCKNLPSSNSVKRTSAPAVLHGDGRSAT